MNIFLYAITFAGALAVASTLVGLVIIKNRYSAITRTDFDDLWKFVQVIMIGMAIPLLVSVAIAIMYGSEFPDTLPEYLAVFWVVAANIVAGWFSWIWWRAWSRINTKYFQLRANALTTMGVKQDKDPVSS